jgi:methyltransferase (TIGR00027 family)
MKQASRTAIRVAMRRYAHYLLDAEPKILRDTFAREFTGYFTDEQFLAAFKNMPGGNVLWLNVSFALRSRLIEDELEKEVARGSRQYVILGAGLDSFAYRRRDLMSVIDVFEVDHPASQAWKRERVSELGISCPASLHYAPVDFERDSLTDSLVEAGLDRSKSIFFCWPGVTQYITKDAAQRTSHEIATLSTARSTLVLDFIVPVPEQDEEGATLIRTLTAAGAKSGEPWLSFYAPAEIAHTLLSAGFDTVELIDRTQACDRYLADRSDGARLPPYFGMAKAST